MIVEVDRYCRRTGMDAPHLFRCALGGPAALYRLRRGGSITADTTARLRQFMAEHPEGVEKGAKGRKRVGL